MNKLKILIACLLLPFFVLIIITFIKIKKTEEYQQKVVLAQEIRKGLEHLMVDLLEARENTIMDVPADGLWHNHVAFDRPYQGILEYSIKDGQLLRDNNGNAALIADNISALRIRRQKATPDILEIQIEAQKNVTLISNSRIRIR